MVRRLGFRLGLRLHRPAESVRFVMEVNGKGDPPGWWITVEA
jgi:hypothetical protein